MKVSELGEFKLIELLAEIADESQGGLPARQELFIGIGDDAAAWRSDSKINMATVDCLTQDVHFTLKTATWNDLGWKALATGLSDIAAMGGTPEYALVSLGLPDDTEVDDAADLYRGMVELGNRFGIAIVGGNISSAAIVFISTTVFGTARGQDRLLTRHAARASDKIAVTGCLGAAATGLEMFKKQTPLTPEDSAALRQAFFHPHPRVAEGQLLAELGVKAAIDISDGLIADLGHICQESRVGARIEVDCIPIHPTVKKAFGDRSLEMALSGGEDYELLFTASAGVIDRVTAGVTCPVTVIGEVVADKAARIALIDKQGKPYKIGRVGWQHFAAKG